MDEILRAIAIALFKWALDLVSEIWLLSISKAMYRSFHWITTGWLHSHKQELYRKQYDSHLHELEALYREMGCSDEVIAAHLMADFVKDIPAMLSRNLKPRDCQPFNDIRVGPFDLMAIVVSFAVISMFATAVLFGGAVPSSLPALLLSIATVIVTPVIVLWWSARAWRLSKERDRSMGLGTVLCVAYLSFRIAAVGSLGIFAVAFGYPGAFVALLQGGSYAPLGLGIATLVIVGFMIASSELRQDTSDLRSFLNVLVHRYSSDKYSGYTKRLRLFGVKTLLILTRTLLWLMKNGRPRRLSRLFQSLFTSWSIYR